MANHIPQTFIDDLLQRVDIINIIDPYVSLKKEGQDHVGLCPFHDEKTPSFKVSQTKQFYHCFGCGVHGNAISFLIEYSSMGFIDAVAELASKVGMEVPSSAATTYQQSDDLYQLMESVKDYFIDNLKQRGKKIKLYLNSERGVSDETIEKFGIGYAPDGWNNLLNNIKQSKHQQLETLGLTKKAKANSYDRFRNRIMFPIHDLRGRTIAFGGRATDDDQAKYLNSPETVIFQKRRELYGAYQAKQALKKIPSLFVVEGYMDVIMLSQYGVFNAVATLGTAVTAEQINQLFRCSRKLIFCFDGDAAGRQAAWRALENILPYIHDERQIFFMFLPDGYDPDSYLRQHGSDIFTKLHDQYMPLSQLLFETLQKDTDLNMIEGRSALIEKALPLIQKVPSQAALRHLLIQELGQRSTTEYSIIKELITARKQAHVTRKQASKSTTHSAPHSARKNTKLRWIIRALIHNPNLAASISDELRHKIKSLDIKGSDFLIELLNFIDSRDNIVFSNIIEHWRDTIYAKSLDDMTEEIMQMETSVTEEELKDAILKLCRTQVSSEVLKKKPSELTPEEKDMLRAIKSTPTS